MQQMKYALFAVTAVVTVIMLFEIYTGFQSSVNSKRAVQITNDKLSVKQPEKHHTTGYVLALFYYGQQTSATQAMYNLQCWAGQHNAGLKVVEPFMLDSNVFTPFLASKKTDTNTKLGDLVDLATWNNHSVSRNYSEVVSWEVFLKNAPRRVIAVTIYTTHGRNASLAKDVKLHPQKYRSPVRYKSGCKPLSLNSKLLNQWNFQVVREVCFNLEYGDTFTMQQFDSDLYGEHSPSNVTVVFSTWYARMANGKIKSDIKCDDSIPRAIVPGQAIQEDAEKYIGKYLNGRRYMATMIRMERTPNSADPNVVHKCLDLVIDQWEKMKSATNLSQTFLSADIGKYGSKGMKRGGRSESSKTEYPHFFEHIFGKSFALAEWEHTFEDVARSNNTGYIALLQMWLVVKADCVVFSGGGSFQQHALSLYRQYHPNKQCYEVVTECTNHMLLKMIR